MRAGRPALCLFLCAAPLGAWQAEAVRSAPAKAAVKPADQAAARPAVAAAPLAPIQSVKLEGSRLANGMRLYLVENHELPVVYGTAVWDGGSVFDPPEEPGLAWFTSEVLRSGGTRAQTEEELNTALEGMGARLESGSSTVHANLSFSGLREHAVDLLRVVRDVLVTPGFRLEKIELARAQIRDRLETRNENPLAEARRELASVLYGRETPYGRQEDEAAFVRIRPADVRAFFERHCVPGGVTLAVAGDFDAAQLKGEIEKLFGGWTAAAPAATELPPFQPRAESAVYTVKARDFSRSAFAMGQLGGGWRDRDTATWTVLLNVLGGERHGRLRQKVPSTAANPIGIGAGWRRAFGYAGIAEISGNAPAFEFPQVLQAVHAEMERLRNSEASEDELRRAKEEAVEALAVEGDSSPKRLARDVEFELFGYPGGFVGQYQRAIMAVTRADVERLAKERLDWNRFTMVAVGDSEMVGKYLADAGRPGAAALETPADPVKATVPAGDAEAAKLILRKAIAASGGMEKIGALQDVTRSALWEFAPSAGGERMAETAVWMPPNHFREELVGVGRVLLYTDGKVGWISNGRASAILKGTSFERARRDLFRLYPRLLLSAGIAGRTIGAVDDHAIEIREGDLEAEVTFDPANWLASKILYEVKSQAGRPVAVEEDLLDYREVVGVKLPFRMRILQNGEETGTVTVREWKMNQGLKLMDVLRQP